MAPKLLHDSRWPGDEAARAIERASRRGIEITDTASWTEQDRWAVYMNELMPRSIMKKKRLRGRIRTHQAGMVTFIQPVLITEDDFFVGFEIVEHFDSTRANKSVQPTARSARGD